VEQPADDFARVRLILARRRDLGESFDEAWPKALGALPPLPPSGCFYARQAAVDGRAALHVTREDWRLAYERLPPRPGPTAGFVTLDGRASAVAA